MVANAGRLWVETQAALKLIEEGQRVDFDMTKVEAVDGTSMALLVALRAELHRRGVPVEFVGASEQVQRTIQLYSGDVKVGVLPRRRARGLLDQLGPARCRCCTAFSRCSASSETR